MFISRLELTGFKSFASRTLLEFKPGVMAVVGPNGCGKTNIVDAIRWVLGEQRTGALRAERMEAVIFNGTSKRKPVGMSEVILTIENDKGVLPSPYTEIAIARRLFRSGESEYLINRNPSRLRDINDMFADTGLGSSAYSIIELAMVEGIVSGPPAVRRQLFEEAAGVSRYKSRRLAAQKRLEFTRENLHRVDDIYQEIEKSYQTLKRQATRARRYQQFAQAIRHRLIADLAEERLDLISRRSPLESRLKELEIEREQAETAATQATSELLALEGRELSLTDRSNRTQDTLKRLDRREAEMQGELALIRQRIEYLNRELKQGNGRRTELSTASGHWEEQRRNAVTGTAELKNLAEAQQQRRRELETEVSKLTEASEKLRLEVAAARETEIQAQQAAIEYRDKFGSENESRQRSEIHLSTRVEENNRLTSELELLKRNYSEAAATREKLTQQHQAVIGKLESAEQSLDQARQRGDEALKARGAAAAAAEAASAALEAHRAQPAFRRPPEALQKLFPKGKFQSLAARLECLPEHRAALTIALYGILDSVDLPQDSGIKLPDLSHQDGSSILRLPVSQARDRAEKSWGKEIRGSIPGAALVQNQDELGTFLRSRLSDLLLVPDFESLVKYADRARELGVKLVTPKGELLEPDGVLFIGSIDPKSAKVGWEAMGKQLEAAFWSAASEWKKSELDLEAATLELKSAGQAVEELRRSRRLAEDELDQAERRYRNLDQEIKHTQDRLGQLKTDMENLRRELQSLSDDQFDPAELKRLEAAWESARVVSERLQGELRELDAQRNTLSHTLSRVVAELASASERMAFADREADRSETESRKAGADLAALEARMAEAGVELERVQQAEMDNQAQLGLLAREKDDVTRTADAARNERTAIKTARDAANNKLNQAQKQQKASYQERTQVETDSVTIRERLREVDRRLVEDAEFQPGDVDESTPQNMLAALGELDLADVSAEKLKIRLQSLGPVNMLALEELKAVEERYRFLTDQKKDLERGIEVLNETIDRINFDARRLFRETIEQINIHFQDTFRTLFEGGEARVTLAEGDPLEADIRIWATPSGKKLQSLSMLSGGEKALTAVALLFSIYRARPTPFCILDEVDAPLDDANVTRFNKLLRQHTRDTQFLIVTHNKRTMEAADCLYGVTLAEDGTSRIVSVTINGRQEPVPSQIGVEVENI